MHAQFMRSRLWQAMLGLTLLSSAPLHAASFVYEGQLDDRGAPANGRYDIQLAVYRDIELGATVTAPVVFSAVDVVAGRFRLDFEVPLEAAEPAWVELAVRDAGGSGFSAIPGRTKATEAPAAIGACWSSVGDSGSNPVTNFLGTTDNQPLVLRVNGQQTLRLVPGLSPSLIGGFSGNAVNSSAFGATIGGGGQAGSTNQVTDSYGTVGGGSANQAGDGSGTVIDRPYATVSGGVGNTASGAWSTVGGGQGNDASGLLSTVGGGDNNAASGNNATAAGGYQNLATAGSSAVGGGFQNIASGDYGSTVAGGANNTASGDRSTVSGGFSNCAGGAFSWAGGLRAKVRPGTASGAPGLGCDALALSGDADGDAGSFVWADSQIQLGDFVSNGNDQFAIRARGGLRWGGTGINSTTSPAFIHQVQIGTNTCDSGGTPVNSRTWINHPLLNDNPNAVIVLTPNFGSTAGGGVPPPRNPIGLYYNATLLGGCPAGRWVIYQLTVTAETLLNGARFNAWFVLP